MKKDVSELWKCMPLLYTLVSDSVFDEDYVYKGFVFIKIVRTKNTPSFRVG